MHLTIKDIAKLANVSTATVSRTINNPERVSEEKRKLINSIIQDTNYFPNALARGLIQEKTKTIGVLIPDINNLYYPAVVRGLEDSLEENNYSLLLCNTDKCVDKEIRYLNMLLEKRVDGVVLMGTRPVDSKKNAHIKVLAKQIPVVMVNDYIVGSETYSVLSDETEGAYKAVSYLIKLGHKRIAYFSGESGFTTYENKRKGYAMAIGENNIPLQPNYIFSDTGDEAGGTRSAEKLLKMKSPRPSAIFAASDQIALGIFKALFEANYNIPKDFSVLGYANIPISSLVYPELTTINQFPYETGKMAAELLLEILAGKQPNQKKYLIEPQLLVRKSCREFTE